MLCKYREGDVENLTFKLHVQIHYKDGNVGVGDLPEGQENLTAWSLAGEQRQNHSGHSRQRGSFHPAPS